MDFAMSRPTVIACMFSSSDSWKLQQHPHLWHSRAGGGAVHSIKSGHRLLLDHFVGALLQEQWDVQPERFRRLKIDSHQEFRG
jgi:hypothetical protein